MQKVKSHALSSADSHIQRSCYYSTFPSLSLNDFTRSAYEQQPHRILKCEFTEHSKFIQYYRKEKNDVEVVRKDIPLKLHGEDAVLLESSPHIPIQTCTVRNTQFYDCDGTNILDPLPAFDHHRVYSSAFPLFSLSTSSMRYCSMASSSEYLPSNTVQNSLTSTVAACSLDSFNTTASMQKGTTNNSSLFSLLRQPVPLPSPTTDVPCSRIATHGEHYPWPPFSSPRSPSVSRSDRRALMTRLYGNKLLSQRIPSSRRSQRHRMPYAETTAHAAAKVSPVASGFFRYCDTGRHPRPSSPLVFPNSNRLQVSSFYDPTCSQSFVTNGRFPRYSPPSPFSTPSDVPLPQSLERLEGSFSRRRTMAAKVVQVPIRTAQGLSPLLQPQSLHISTNRISSPLPPLPLSSRSTRRSSYYYSGKSSLKRPPLYFSPPRTVRRAPFSSRSRSRWRSRWQSKNSRRKSSYGIAPRKQAYDAYPMGGETYTKRRGSSSCEGYSKQRRVLGDTRFPPRQLWDANVGSSNHYFPYRSRKRKVWKNDKIHDQYGNDDREKKQQKSKKEAKPDEIVHFEWTNGMLLNNRYRVVDLMGEGTFGRVLRCHDTKMHTDVAVKVVRDVARYTAAAKIETSILEDIRSLDVQQQSRCVLLLDSFMHESRHMCLVFEKLGLSLYDLLSQNDYKGFFMGDIRIFAQQTLQTLAFLHKIKLTHTDLKPENILLECDPSEMDMVPFLRVPPHARTVETRRPRRADVKLIDFGSATYEDEHHSAIINTRQYRAPEVIFGLGWDMSSDVWSLGCILMELYTGCLLFKTHEHLEHLAMIERIVGPFPPRLVKHTRKCDGKKYIHPVEERLFWPEGASGNGSVLRVKQCVSLVDLVLPAHRPFAEFVRYLLEIEAINRPSPQEALQHSFFKIDLSEC